MIPKISLSWKPATESLNKPPRPPHDGNSRTNSVCRSCHASFGTAARTAGSLQSRSENRHLHWRLNGRGLSESSLDTVVPGLHWVSSGSDALRLALTAAGVRPGDIVLTAPNTFAATIDAISRSGAPDFVDVDEHTYSLDWMKRARTKSRYLLFCQHLLNLI